jgi:hypothetical protein
MNLGDSVFPLKERARNQLRIPLNNSLGVDLITDTSNFRSDSAFKDQLKGFAIVPRDNGLNNALVGFNLLDSNTKLSFYYRAKNGTSKPDTSVFYLRFSSTSGSANYIKKDSTGSEMLANRNSTEYGYISNIPYGGYVHLAVPNLGNLNNRVVHAAQLIVEQVYDPLADTFPPPQYLYLDLFDSSVQDKYRAIPYDVSFITTGQVVGLLPVFQVDNVADFGMLGKKTPVGANNVFRWKFNISRYVQHIVTGTDSVYNMRLSAPYFLKETIGNNINNTRGVVPVNSNYGIGRLRIGGGAHPTQRMKLRIVYSKI